MVKTSWPYRSLWVILCIVFRIKLLNQAFKLFKLVICPNQIIYNQEEEKHFQRRKKILTFLIFLRGSSNQRESQDVNYKPPHRNVSSVLTSLTLDQG